MSYLRLDSDPIQLTGSVDQESGPPVYRLARGETYSPKPESLPFRFSYSGTLCAYYSAECLMSRPLVDALHEAGVDNLEVFPAVLVDSATGNAREDYCVVNVVGKVAAADMKQSAAIPLGDKQVFTKLTVDPGKAKDLLMFRLAESLVDVIVHEKVARAIAARQLGAVALSPVTAE